MSLDKTVNALKEDIGRLLDEHRAVISEVYDRSPKGISLSIGVKVARNNQGKNDIHTRFAMTTGRIQAVVIASIDEEGKP